jgi:hypothetical protein
MLPSMHLLEAAPTATMWMHLGSVIGEIEHYEHAWTLSNQHLARAKLKLGSKARSLEQWEEARTEGASTHPAGGLATSSCGQASGQNNAARRPRWLEVRPGVVPDLFERAVELGPATADNVSRLQRLL